ncbi:MAG: hypothetical protein ACLGHN_14590 [Bacteriovoracia bacterium]
MKLALIFVLSLFYCLKTSASDWSTISYSQFDVEVSVSYKKESHYPGCYKCSATTMAAPFYVNIWGPSISNAGKIRVVLTSIRYGAYGNQINRESYVMDLVRMPEGHFSGEFGNSKKLFFDQEIELKSYEKKLTIHQTGYGGAYHYEQEVAVVIDGHWLRNKTLSLY